MASKSTIKLFTLIFVTAIFILHMSSSTIQMEPEIHHHDAAAPLVQVAAPTKPPAPKVDPVQLVAFYYGWYHKSKDQQQGWFRHGRNEDPLLGFYESHDTRVTEQHIEWATAYGIDAFAISTFFMPDNLLEARNINKIKIIPLVEYWAVWEAPHIYDLSEVKHQETMNAYLKKLIPLLTHPQVMKIDGKVVVYFYLTRLMRNFPEGAVQNMTRGLPVEIFWVADEVFPFGDESNPMASWHALRPEAKLKNGPLFDAYTAYNMYALPLLLKNPKTRHAGMNMVDYMKEHMLPTYKLWAEHTRFFPHIAPKYRDFRPENTPIWGNPEDFRQILRITKQLPRGPQAKSPFLIFLTTWNEWWEGTSIEPSEQWGFGFLEVLREEMKPHLPAPGFTVDQYRNPKDKASAWWQEYRDFMTEQYAGREPTVFPQPTKEIPEEVWNAPHNKV